MYRKNNCGCDREVYPQDASCPVDDDMYTGRTALPEDTVVAMAYVPFQLNRKTYDAGTALCKGTLFPVLNKPFKGACMR